MEHEDHEEEELPRLLKQSLKEENVPSLLPSIQREIRRRSRGRFFGDGSSVAQSRSMLLVVTSVMLLVLLLLYAFLGPTGFSAD